MVAGYWPVASSRLASTRHGVSGISATSAPAIANAVADALGADVAEIPLTPWRVLASRLLATGQ